MTLATLHLPVRLEAVSLAGAAARQACEVLGLGETVGFQAELALVEACTNVVEHACAGTPDATYTVELRQDGDGLEACIRDRGRATDVYARPVPMAEPDAAGFDDLREGGYGLPLIFTVARRVHFERVDGENRLRLHFGGAAA